MEPTWAPHNRGTDKEAVVYICNGFSFSYKGKQSSVLRRKMHAAEVITLSELRQFQKDIICLSLMDPRLCIDIKITYVHVT